MNNIDLHAFKFRKPVNIRFSDFDMLAHINNANYLTYLEEARIQYFNEVITAGRVNWRKEGIILSRMEIDFLKPITGYENYFANVRVSRLGNKSFDFEYVITLQNGNDIQIIAHARSVVVCFDYAINQTITIKPEWKKMIEEFEPDL